MRQPPARQHFRVLTQSRNGYGGATMFDVQLQSIESGRLMWAQTFSDRRSAEEFEHDLQADLEELDADSFRRKYGMPADT